MGSLIDDMATWLDTNSTRLTLGTNLFKYSGVDSTAAICWLTDDQGSPPTRVYGSRWPVSEEPTLTVISRSTRPTQGDWVNPTAARRLSQAVWSLLETVADTSMPTSTGRRVWRAEAIGSPGDAGRDDSGRLHFMQVFTVTRTPSTSDWG
jgi:hypothetical protein